MAVCWMCRVEVLYLVSRVCGYVRLKTSVRKVAVVPYHQTTEQLCSSGCDTTRLILSAINISFGLWVRPTDEVMKNQSDVSQMVLLAYVGHVEESLLN